jgi:hypothetical protein
MQRVEQIDRTLSHIERVKTDGGQRWPHKFPDGQIICPNQGHLLWHSYTAARQRTEQDHCVLIAEGVDAARSIRTRQGGLGQRKSRAGREMQRQDVKTHLRFSRDRRTHPFQPLQKRLFLYRIIWMHEGKMAMTACHEVLGGKRAQRLAGKDDRMSGILLSRYVNRLTDEYVSRQTSVLKKEYANDLSLCSFVYRRPA